MSREFTTVVIRDAKEPIQLGKPLLGGVVAAASTGNLVEEMFRIEASAAPAAPVASVPGLRQTDPLDSARIGDYNAGWNDRHMAEIVPLSNEQIFEIAEPFGEFQFGDAQGDKRIQFARAIMSAMLAPLAAAPVVQAELQLVRLPERRNENEGNSYSLMQAMAFNQALDDVARLNSPPAQPDAATPAAAPEAQAEQQPVAVLYGDGSVLTKAECGSVFDICCGAQTPLYAAPIAHTATAHPDASVLVEALEALRDAVTPEVIDWVRCGLSVNGRLRNGSHPALEKLHAAYHRAALAGKGGAQ